jgi:hypothetical protein
MNVPNDMKQRKALEITAPKVGALQISKGRIGDLAILISQNAKKKKQATPTTKGAMTVAEAQPAKGAWL